MLKARLRSQKQYEEMEQECVDLYARAYEKISCGAGGIAMCKKQARELLMKWNKMSAEFLWEDPGEGCSTRRCCADLADSLT
jgi:hypothetical protein